jgi:hypothetical protein
MKATPTARLKKLEGAGERGRIAIVRASFTHEFAKPEAEAENRKAEGSRVLQIRWQWRPNPAVELWE